MVYYDKHLDVDNYGMSVHIVEVKIILTFIFISYVATMVDHMNNCRHVFVSTVVIKMVNVIYYANV